MNRAKRGEAPATFFRLLAIETDECVLWPFAKYPKGYGQVVVNGVHYGTHVLACSTAHGPKPTPKHEAAHGFNGKPCKSRSCMNPRHLRWATRAENSADSIAHGTSGRGEDSAQVKLTEPQARSVFDRVATGETMSSIAADYGVSVSTVSSIIYGHHWAWLGLSSRPLPVKKAS